MATVPSGFKTFTWIWRGGELSPIPKILPDLGEKERKAERALQTCDVDALSEIKPQAGAGELTAI